jgi:hypothetical protein
MSAVPTGVAPCSCPPGTPVSGYHVPPLSRPECGGASGMLRPEFRCRAGKYIGPSLGSFADREESAASG